MSRSPYGATALRAGVLHFLSGKAASALLTFVLLLSLVRLMTVPDYATYVSLVALLELGGLFASFGLPWIATRYLPEFRLQASGPRLGELTRWLLICMIAADLVWALLVALLLTPLLDILGLVGYRQAFEIFLAVLFVESVSRRLRDNVLGALMMQREARLALVARQTAFLVGVALLAHGPEVSVTDVILAELAASTVGLLIAATRLMRGLSNLRALPGAADWCQPRRSEMFRTGLPMYGVSLLAAVHSPQILVLILQRMLGSDVAAAFGFIRMLYVQIVRYLPAALLASLLRPRLVAAYVEGGGVQAITRDANLAGKLSLFVLMPVLAFAAGFGQELVRELSGGKFATTGLEFPALLLALVPLSQRQLLEVVAVATGHSVLCMRAAMAGPLALPIMIGLLQLGAGVWSAIVALILGNSSFVMIVVLALTRRIGYAPDRRGLLRLMLGAGAGAATSVALALALPPVLPSWFRLSVGAAAATASFLLVTRLFRPFSESERDRLNRFIGRRIFIW